MSCEKNFLLNQGYWEPGGGRVPELLLVRVQLPLDHQRWWRVGEWCVASWCSVLRGEKEGGRRGRGKRGIKKQRAGVQGREEQGPLEWWCCAGGVWDSTWRALTLLSELRM